MSEKKRGQLPEKWALPRRHGFSVIPLLRGSKRPASGWKRFQKVRASLAEVENWNAAGQNCGIVTGLVSDLVVLDLDSAEAIAEAESRGLPLTPRAKTPRGLHVLLRPPPGLLVRNAIALFPGADLRGEGGFVVASGSEYTPTVDELKAGKIEGKYVWLVSPDDVAVAPMMDWLLNLVMEVQAVKVPKRNGAEGAPHQESTKSIEAQINAVRTADVGTRNETLNRVSFALGKACATCDQLEANRVQGQLMQAAIDSGLPMLESLRTLESGWAAGQRETNMDPTEDGVALGFSEKFGSDFKYDYRIGTWYRWQQTKWARVPVTHVIDEVRTIARPVKLRRASAIRGAELLARSDPRHRLAGEWDHDPFLLGTPEGVVDLRSGQVRESRREDLISKQTVVAPSAGAPALWETFLLESTGGDQQLVGFLQRLCGYSLTGDIREHSLIFVYGPGGNGKSVFLNTIRAILHDYAVIAPTDTFTASPFAKHPTDMAMLQGARLVSASETERGKAWDEVRVKQLTGGDPITARYMRQDFFTFQPTFKVLIAGNHHPELRDVDDALRRRIRMVPFTRRPENPDPELESKLRAEHGRILTWMIDGCCKWLNEGLNAPAAVMSATKDYFAEQDGIARWIEECCVKSPSAREIPADLFASWVTFAHESGYASVSARSFGDSLVRHGFARVKSNGARYHTGIALRPVTMG